MLVVVTEGIDRAHREVDHHIDGRGWEAMTERREFLDMIHVLRNRLDFIKRCIRVCTQPEGEGRWIILDKNTLLSDHCIALLGHKVGQSIA